MASTIISFTINTKKIAFLWTDKKTLKNNTRLRTEDICFFASDIKLVSRYIRNLLICQELFKINNVFIQIYELLPDIQMSFGEFCGLING